MFVAGATGAVGRPLVRRLAEAGHEVVAMTRSESKAGELRALGAEPVVADALDREAVLRAVREAGPEAVIHQLTALTELRSLRRFDDEFALTNRLRTEGTDHLLDAAAAAGARRFVAQSFGGWIYAPGPGPATEDDPVIDPPPAAMSQTLAGIRHLEDAVTSHPQLEGIALRYGGFYGPGTSVAREGVFADELRRRRLPVIGDGRGVWSFTHVEDAASAAARAVEHGAPGIYNVADDEPAPVSEWLPWLAAAVGAQPPRRVPRWVGRLAVGEPGLHLFLESRGMSNAKARRELGWEPRFASWREGFRRGLA